MRIDRTTLARVGTSYTFTTAAGQHLGVICHPTGRRSLTIYDPEDPDTVRSAAALNAEEAHNLADLLHTANTVDHIPDASTDRDGDTDGDATKSTVVRFRVTAGSLLEGHRLRDTLTRAAPGAVILAVIRDHSIITGPNSTFEFFHDDTIVAAGTASSIADLHRALAHD